MGGYVESGVHGNVVILAVALLGITPGVSSRYDCEVRVLGGWSSLAGMVC